MSRIQCTPKIRFSALEFLPILVNQADVVQPSHVGRIACEEHLYAASALSGSPAFE